MIGRIICWLVGHVYTRESMKWISAYQLGENTCPRCGKVERF